MSNEHDVRPSARAWPTGDYTRTPYWVYTDQDVFDREMEMIFRGPNWNFLALECEIPNPGDFVTRFVGTTPVVVQRAQNGSVKAFVNRCSHKGMQVVRELSGNQRSHICPYHQWCYGSDGALLSVPLQHGDTGQGGMPADFDKREHGMRPLRTEALAGVIFGTLDSTAPGLKDFLGEKVVGRLLRTLKRPLRVSGYHRHTLKANWKLFAENSRDAYHAPMLHPFLPTFGFMSPSDRGACEISDSGVHSLISVFNDAADSRTERGKQSHREPQLEDPSLMEGFKENDEGLSLNIISIFPSTLFTCVGNTLSVRQIRPKGIGMVELLYIHFGFVDDTPEQRAMRRKQANLFGPAGYVAIEDVEALELTQAAIAKGEDREASLIEMGGRGTDNQQHVVTELPIRGFWKGYSAQMGYAPQVSGAAVD